MSSKKRKYDGKVATYIIDGMRLGNILFCVTAGLTLAKRTNRQYRGAIFSGLGDVWPGYVKFAQEFLKQRNIGILTLDEIKNTRYQYITEQVYLCNGFPNFTEKNVLLTDYYQDNRCIDKDIAYNYFKITQSISKEIDNLYGDLSNYVAIHIRRGDYLNRPDLYNTYTKKQILEICDKYFPNEKFIILSDDIDWCKDNFSNDDRFIFSKTQSLLLDFYTQTKCKGNIISNSSFAWWGAYLNPNKNKKVVCPWPWFKNGINEDHLEPMATLLPEDWIKHEFK